MCFSSVVGTRDSNSVCVVVVVVVLLLACNYKTQMNPLCLLELISSPYNAVRWCNRNDNANLRVFEILH